MATHILKNIPVVEPWGGKCISRSSCVGAGVDNLEGTNVVAGLAVRRSKIQFRIRLDDLRKAVENRRRFAEVA